MKFELGQVVITRACKAHLERTSVQPLIYLQRHINGDWGDLKPDDKRANDLAIEHQMRIFSSYKLPSGKKLWIITEWDRSHTTLLLPEDY